MAVSTPTLVTLRSSSCSPNEHATYHLNLLNQIQRSRQTMILIPRPKSEFAMTTTETRRPNEMDAFQAMMRTIRLRIPATSVAPCKNTPFIYTFRPNGHSPQQNTWFDHTSRNGVRVKASLQAIQAHLPHNRPSRRCARPRNPFIRAQLHERRGQRPRHKGNSSDTSPGWHARGSTTSKIDKDRPNQLT